MEGCMFCAGLQSSPNQHWWSLQLWQIRWVASTCCCSCCCRMEGCPMATAEQLEGAAGMRLLWAHVTAGVSGCMLARHSGPHLPSELQSGLAVVDA
jgi:hypothetical protein